MFHNVKSKLTSAQHWKSITSNLLEFTSKIYSGFAEKRPAGFEYFDVSKAFDRITNCILAQQMKRIGFGITYKYVYWPPTTG